MATVVDISAVGIMKNRSENKESLYKLSQINRYHDGPLTQNKEKISTLTNMPYGYF